MNKEDFLNRFRGWNVPGTVKPFMIKGEWAVHELFEHLAEERKLDVRIATFSISTDSLNPIFLQVDDGNIKSLKFLLDFSCRKNKLDRFLFARNFASEIRVDKNHAKIMLAQDRNEFKFGMVGSANLNLNPRWECGIYFQAGDMYDFFSNKFNDAYERAMPVDGLT